ncbi:MAG: DNA helicase RecQ [Alphaproteobacteria bacterium]
MDDAKSLARSVFGFAEFRPAQEAVIAAVLGGEDVLAIMPTGSGKSLCYQLPALLGEGLTLVVSPLIALMRDQARQLEAYGVPAGCLNSSNPPAENRRTLARAQSGELRLLYAAPERLVRDDVLDALKRMRVARLAIDEAHCVSQWGHDFRPDYMALGRVREALSGVQTVAFTATADAATREDIAARLFAAPPRLFVQGFDRPNLRLAMSPKSNRSRQLVAFLEPHRGESGIVYCNSRKDTEAVAAMLAANGHAAVAYHAGMEAADRERAQDRFQQEDGTVVVATVAFGMGIDKPDVRFVAHAGLPKSIEAYYQEIGRAGRDGLPADTLTLYGLDDIQLRRRQIDESAASEAQKQVEHRRLGALLALCEAPRCRRQTLLAYFGETLEGACGRCDLCETAPMLADATVAAQKAMSAILRTGEVFGTEHLIAILLGESTENVLRRGHDRLPTFGVGTERDRHGWRSLFRQLSGLGLIETEMREYAGWRVTPTGRAVLRGGERLMLREDVLAPTARRRTKRAEAPAEIAVADATLLAALKARRRELAQALAVPAYVVFPDRTLIELAVRKPTSLDALGEVHGVGARKLARFGDDFLTVIRAHAS